ncbi:MAG: MDR family MFS transporter [Xanthobacteraceae bacterium]
MRDEVKKEQNLAPVMFGLMLSLFLANLDQTIIATCLSAIAGDLQRWNLLPWVISAYLVTSTATTPIYGRLSDNYGRRNILLLSISLFVAASVLCAMATTMPLLIGARVLQGIGGGGLRSISQIVIADIIPPRFRGRYQGYMSGTFLISTTLGPVLGGFFAEYLSWRWAFWINLPLGLLALFVIDRQLRKLNLPRRQHKIDWLGAFLVLCAAVPIMIGLSRVEQEGGWSQPAVFVPIMLGIVATGMLIFVEFGVAEPILPMRLFSNKIFTLGNIALFAPSMVMTTLIIVVPLYYQVVRQWSPDEAGLPLIALTAGMALGSFVIGSAISRIGRAKIFPIAGGLLAAGVCLLLGLFGLGRSTVFDAVCLLLLGSAIGCQINPLLVMIQNGLQLRDIGAGVSGMTFFRSLAGAFGVAEGLTLLIGRLAAGATAVPGHEKLGPDPGIGLLRPYSPDLFDQAQRAAFELVREHAFTFIFFLAAAVFFITVLLVLMVKERPLRAITDEQ